MSDPRPHPGARAAVAAVVLAFVAGILGAGGTGLALALVPGVWSDTAQLVVFSTPSTLAALLGAGAVPLGLLAAARGLPRIAGWIGCLGALAGVAVVTGAVAWFAFLGGLAVLASLAWH